MPYERNIIQIKLLRQKINSESYQVNYDKTSDTKTIKVRNGFKSRHNNSVIRMKTIPVYNKKYSCFLRKEFYKNETSETENYLCELRIELLSPL